MKMLLYILAALFEFIAVYYITGVRNKYNDISQKTGGRSYIIRPSETVYLIGTIVYLSSKILFYIIFILALLGHASIELSKNCLISAFTGLIILFFTSKWQVIVLGKRIAVKKIFHKTEKISLSDIDEAVRVYKKTKFGFSQVLYLHKDKGTIVKIKSSSDNYEKFINKLERFELLKN